jgi:phasin family protein
MKTRIKDFMSEQAQDLSERGQNLRRAPVEAARKAATRTAGHIKSLSDPVQAFARSGVKLTAISQGTAQSLIELQAEIVARALGEAATHLERAAEVRDLRDLVRDQAAVLRATRDRIVSDMTRAVAIFKDAGGDVRKVASGAYTQAARPAAKKAPAAKRGRAGKAKRAVRKTTGRARQS